MGSHLNKWILNIYNSDWGIALMARSSALLLAFLNHLCSRCIKWLSALNLARKPRDEEGL
jgi:hypothetical protein